MICDWYGVKHKWSCSANSFLYVDCGYMLCLVHMKYSETFPVMGKNLHVILAILVARYITVS